MMEKALTIERRRLQVGGEAILLAVRPDAFVELEDGPHSGVTLLPHEARLLAYHLLLLAQEIDCGATR
jgi:hypothetical protein